MIMQFYYYYYVHTIKESPLSKIWILSFNFKQKIRKIRLFSLFRKIRIFRNFAEIGALLQRGECIKAINYNNEEVLGSS